ncbi:MULTISPECIES: glycosyltransferase family 4 protein [Pseudomonas]|uniref:glycosyltransferase family 4 protein n=2 Tax=Pseudomonadati TaxID=3379134 RepID=UPI000CF702D6|nr:MULTISPECIES: glycosyltransferase family 4 protein [Pseudomonas]VVM79100.1 N-acetyl-alpha-D-glucosaminyl L-malate synthase [Pseudomonas fluorescens]AVJ37307.1 glycosyltransferase family 1 protein [Pseudomonas lurida]PRA14443.1 glycosyltransferase family 1 protein [Pseudomonas sp. MYb13]PRA20024.1 glycosyltransferase family 1 protein [Pseudomonas lurida]PRA31897.1 glycosyltransferase family 1 protein [Pseudomonas lurida]
MKVLYVITRSDVIGGASVHLLDLANGVQEAGHEVAIVVGGHGIFIEKARERGLRCFSAVHLVRPLSVISDFRFYVEFRRIVLEWKPDLIHAHSSKAGIVGRLVAKTLSIPCVFTAHGWAFTEGVATSRRILYRCIERLVANFTSKIITVSDYDRSLALRSGVGAEDLIVTIHNGMPSVTEEASVTGPSKVTRLIMVARFDAPKDHVFLVRALASLPRSDWAMEFVGDGPTMPEVKNLVSELGLEDRFYFAGACSDVSERLSKSDVFCLISNWEGLPLTVLEAMRTGLPVIASRVGGVPEAVAQQETGILVDKHDHDGLVSALSTLIGSRDLRSKMGGMGRTRFLSNFTFELMLQRTISVYSDVTKV